LNSVKILLYLNEFRHTDCYYSKYCSAECRYAGRTAYHYTECFNDERHYIEHRNTDDIILSALNMLHYAGCRYSECRYGERRSAKKFPSTDGQESDRRKIFRSTCFPSD
jgi:hypothetical protein